MEPRNQTEATLQDRLLFHYYHFLFPVKQNEVLYFTLSQYSEPACRIFTIYIYLSSALHTTPCFTTSDTIYLCELHSFLYSVHFCFRLHVNTGNSFRISFFR